MVTQPGGGAQISRSYGMAAQHIGDFAMTPEQGGNEGSSARAMRFGVKVRSAFDQRGRNGGLVGVSRLMQRRPSAVVRIIHVPTGSQQSFDKRKAQIGAAPGGDTHGKVQERISIGAAFFREPRVEPQHRLQRHDIPGFQSPKGRKKGFGRLRVRGRCQEVHR